MNHHSIPELAVAFDEMPLMALPVFLTELNILSVREDGTRITIGPKGELAGFRQADFLKELRAVRNWLRNQTGIDEVLIDVENREYLRGRTLAGLVLLKEDVPEGAKFGVVGESELLDTVLDKMNASDAVPVFADRASAFDYSPPSRWQILAARTTLKVRAHSGRLILGGIILIACTALAAAGLLLLSDPVESDYAALLSTWQQALDWRQGPAQPAELEEQLAGLRREVDDLLVRYVQRASTEDDEVQLLEAARALSTNLRFVGRHEASEREFLRAMQRIAAWHEIDQLPQPAASGLTEYESDNPSDGSAR